MITIKQLFEQSYLNILWIRLLSFLLYLANREPKDNHFYEIKRKLLKKYATHLGYDVQFIEGKKCYSCDGTGVYKRSSYQFGMVGIEEVACYHCIDGWYKPPLWVILERVQFGKYIFHQPIERVFTKPDITPNIQGYIEHKKHEYGWLARAILFFMFEKGYVCRYYKSVYGWRCYWYYPKNWLFTICHFVKYRTRSYPIQDFKLRLKKKWQSLKPKSKNQDKYVIFEMSDDGLPF